MLLPPGICQTQPSSILWALQYLMSPPTHLSYFVKFSALICPRSLMMAQGEHGSDPRLPMTLAPAWGRTMSRPPETQGTCAPLPQGTLHHSFKALTTVVDTAWGAGFQGPWYRHPGIAFLFRDQFSGSDFPTNWVAIHSFWAGRAFFYFVARVQLTQWYHVHLFHIQQKSKPGHSRNSFIQLQHD